jgi:hypothetical protein
MILDRHGPSIDFFQSTGCHRWPGDLGPVPPGVGKRTEVASDSQPHGHGGARRSVAWGASCSDGRGSRKGYGKSWQGVR